MSSSSSPLTSVWKKNTPPDSPKNQLANKLKPPQDLDTILPQGFQDPLMNILSFLAETRSATRASKFISDCHKKAVRDYCLEMFDQTSAYSSSSSGSTVVLDCGSAITKVGFAGEGSPRSTFPTIVGRSRMSRMAGIPHPNFYVGEDVARRRGTTYVTSPILNGEICNWDDMEKIWHHSFFDQLQVSPENHDVILSEALLYRRKDSLSSSSSSSTTAFSRREKIVQIMFETFNVNSLTLQHESVLNLIALEGTDSGVSIELGASDNLRVNLVHKGDPLLPPAYPKMTSLVGYLELPLGGGELVKATQVFLKREHHREFNMNNAAESEIVSDFLREIAVVRGISADSLGSGTMAKPVSYTLPDGEEMLIPGDQQNQVVEMIFSHQNAENTHQNFSSLHSALFSMLRSSRFVLDQREQDDSSAAVDLAETYLWPSIHLCGGWSGIPGLRNRLSAELTKSRQVARLKALNYDPVVQDRHRDAKYAAWCGGSIFAAHARSINPAPVLSGTPDELSPAILKEEYEEYGPQECLLRRSQRMLSSG